MVLQQFDRQVYKYGPDQMIVRLNAIVGAINNLSTSIAVQDPKSDKVIIHGVQPDKSFGVCLWHKQGDNYTLITRIA